jgi:putative oxidoreductase
MASFLQPYAAQTYALLRIVTGFLFLWHGTQKLIGWPAPQFPGTPTFVQYVAGPIELFGGVLVMVGLGTRWAAFLCSGLMAAAYFLAHAFTKLGELGFVGLAPINNGGELAVLYCFVFLFIAAHGPGIWSVEGRRD